MGVIPDNNGLLLIRVEGIVGIRTSLVYSFSSEGDSSPITLSGICWSPDPIRTSLIGKCRLFDDGSIRKFEGERIRSLFGENILRKVGEVSKFIGEVGWGGKSVETIN